MRARRAILAGLVAAGLFATAMFPRLLGASPDIARGPYLQLGTPSGMTVRWRTQSPTDSRVRFGTDPEHLDGVVDEVGRRADHEIRLEGLRPNTVYYYAAGSISSAPTTSAPGNFFITSPEPGSRKPVRVWVVGDSGGANAAVRDTLDAYLGFLGPRHTDLWLMLGDNAYESGTDAEYQRAVFDIFGELLSSSVLWPTLGNHDAGGAYFDLFTLPTQGEAGGVASDTENHYSFDYANIHFVGLDSESSDRSPEGQMAQWLRTDLANTDSDWTIAYWHHAPYSKGTHYSDCDEKMSDMRGNILPILERWGVDLVLAGHSHNYERSVLIDGHYGPSHAVADRMIRNGGNGRPDTDGPYYKTTLGPGSHEGTVYVVVGASSRNREGRLDHPVMASWANRIGSMIIDIDGEHLGARYIDRTGAIVDSFSIVKGVVDPPTPPPWRAAANREPVTCGGGRAGACSIARKQEGMSVGLIVTLLVAQCGIVIRASTARQKTHVE